MMSEKLKKAREFEAAQMKQILPEEYPAFHLTGGVGWINDPNGFSVYKGEYHLFHQYHPYSNEWGPMHWGHVKSSDLLSWERLPIAMAPDTDYDGAGCFSGSALELADGRQLLMYTGVQETEKEDGSTEVRQTQCMAVGDGVSYEKYEANPVIQSASLPQGGRPSDFRDPKIWQDEDGTFYSIMISMREDGNGQAVLYRSENGFDWSFCGILDESCGKLGTMWECPDFFALDGKQVMLLSPMAMQPEEGKYHVGHGTVALVGSYDKNAFKFTREADQPIDWGIDFYAPQTTLTPDGRRVMIAWMQAWPNSKFVPDGVKYFGQLTLPRELSVRDNKLFQNPVRELLSHRGEEICYENMELSGEKTLEGIEGRTLDMTVTLHNAEELQSFSVKFACGGDFFSAVSYNGKKGVLCLDRNHSGYNYDIVHSREFGVEPKNGELKLRFILDRFSAEVFVNDGEKAATMTIYTPQEADGIRFEAEGTARFSVQKYNLIF